jgi:hypothetical protein
MEKAEHFLRLWCGKESNSLRLSNFTGPWTDTPTYFVYGAPHCYNERPLSLRNVWWFSINTETIRLAKGRYAIALRASTDYSGAVAELELLLRIKELESEREINYGVMDDAKKRAFSL